MRNPQFVSGLLEYIGNPLPIPYSLYSLLSVPCSLLPLLFTSSAPYSLFPVCSLLSLCVCAVSYLLHTSGISLSLSVCLSVCFYLSHAYYSGCATPHIQPLSLPSTHTHARTGTSQHVNIFIYIKAIYIPFMRSVNFYPWLGFSGNVAFMQQRASKGYALYTLVHVIMYIMYIYVRYLMK